MPLAYPKEPRIEIPRLLELARIMPRPCMLNVHGQCRLPGRRSEGQCFACHGNHSDFNKAGAEKAHDFFSVWGCTWCHTWLDASYSADGHERQLAFRTALFHQVLAWADLLAQVTIRPKDAEPIKLALDHLVQRGYARLMPWPNPNRMYAAPLPIDHPDYARQQETT